MDHAALEGPDPAGGDLGGGCIGKRDGAAFERGAAFGALAGVFGDAGAGGEGTGRGSIG